MTQRYDTIGVGYCDLRRPDPRIAAAIAAQLGDASRVVNIGAGAGSYEPAGRVAAAVEPSRLMIAQRPRNAAPVACAVAEALPFADRSFDLALAILTIHHWRDIGRGLAEARRVAGRVVLFTWCGYPTHFWLMDYFPEILEVDERILPSVETLAGWLGPVREIPVAIPADCTDGFLCAYWCRPERYLEAPVRLAISTFSRIKSVQPGLDRLAADLRSGRWRSRYGSRLPDGAWDLGYRLVTTSDR